MARECISALTTPGTNYPSFLSVNLDGDQVEFTVRSGIKEDGHCGDVATMKMSMKDFRRVARELFGFGAMSERGSL